MAGSRAGKGASFIVPNLLFYPGSVIANDPKAELVRRTGRRRRQLGQDVAVLDPFGESGLPDSERARFNPLDLIEPDTDEGLADAGLLADALIIQESGSGQHFTMAARNLLHGLIYCVATRYDGARRSLSTVREMLCQDDEAEETRQPGGLIYEMGEAGGFPAQVAASLAGKSPNERSSVLSTAQEQTAFLAGEAMRRTLSESSFAMGDLKSAPHGLSVFLCLPARRMATHAKFMRLMLTVAIVYMEAVPNVSEARKTGTGYPVLFMLDEFSALGHLDVIERAAGLMAGYGVKLWTVLQDLTQLKRDYKEGWETFIGNAGFMQFFGTSDATTCEYISKLLGDTETVTAAMPELTIEHEAQGLAGVNTSVTTAPLLRPNEIRYEFARQTMRQLVYYPGCHPMVIERVEYFRPEHAQLFARTGAV